MENLYRLMVAPALAFAKDASERFDKGALLQIHEFGRQQMEAALGSTFHSVLSFTNPGGGGSGGGGAATSSVPLEMLNPVTFTELQVGKVHHGQVMYGTLCAEALGMNEVITLLEDGNGLALRLAIYSVVANQADIKGLYPRGAKVAVKEPCLKRAADGSILVCVDNPANMVMLMTRNEKLLHVDVEEERKKGNGWFREQKWDAAAEHYTKCIDAALLQLKKRSINDNNNINTCLLHAYSNRAETCLKMKEFERAIGDSSEALRIDPSHFKSLYRKGRALLSLRQYAAACEYLEQANKASPGQTQIHVVLDKAKTLYDQSLNGKYDISDYLLGRSSPPEVADFVGALKIKMTEDGRGRGLYAIRKITTGELLLVSNAVAVFYDKLFNTHTHTHTAPGEDLVAAVVGEARKSQSLLRQIYSLDEYCAPGSSVDVPAIDLFRAYGQEEQSENLRVDVNRIRDFTKRHTFGGARLDEKDQVYFGLWLLPSMINHSCLPNSSRLEVGSAMFIHAAKPIEIGEEITISYFDPLIPLRQREAMCEGWGFKCKCRRCTLEHSLKGALKSINVQFEQLQDKAMEQFLVHRQRLNVNEQFILHQQRLNADEQFIVHQQRLNGDEFARIFVKAEEIIRKSPKLKTEEEKDWIRVSYVSAYHRALQSDELLLAMMENRVPSVRETREAIQNTVPGHIRTLVMGTGQIEEFKIEEFKRLSGDEYQTFITRRASYQARDACIRIFGKQSEDVIEALIFQHFN